MSSRFSFGFLWTFVGRQSGWLTSEHGEHETMKSISAGLLAAVALAATSSVALAEAPKFTYSFNIGGTTDYVFRGYSQTG